MGKRQNFYDTEMQALADTFGTEILARIPPAERMKGLTPEERADMLARLSPDERVKGLSPDERLAGLRPAEIQNLSAEVRAELVRQLVAADNHTDT